MLKNYDYEGEKRMLANYLVDHNIITSDEFDLIVAINGYSLETLESALYARKGLHDLEQAIEDSNITIEDLDY